jgi:hypothetical protein
MSAMGGKRSSGEHACFLAFLTQFVSRPGWFCHRANIAISTVAGRDGEMMESFRRKEVSVGQESSREYYRGRSDRERELARAAINPYIAEIHTELADRYDWLADNLMESHSHLKVVLTPSMERRRAG